MRARKRQPNPCVSRVSSVQRSIGQRPRRSGSPAARSPRALLAPMRFPRVAPCARREEDLCALGTAGESVALRLRGTVDSPGLATPVDDQQRARKRVTAARATMRHSHPRSPGTKYRTGTKAERKPAVTCGPPIRHRAGARRSRARTSSHTKEGSRSPRAPHVDARLVRSDNSTLSRGPAVSSVVWPGRAALAEVLADDPIRNYQQADLAFALVGERARAPAGAWLSLDDKRS